MAQVAERRPIETEPEARWLEPDLGFVRALGGARDDEDSFKRCVQCGTCSATCTLSPDEAPFPRKEMAWATWGLRAPLLSDPDVWLCHHCGDCSRRCPRSAQPGEVLAAVRREQVIHYAVPRFFARWVSQPAALPLLFGLPAAVLAGALALHGTLDPAAATGQPIVYAYSRLFPQWVLNVIFGVASLLALALTAVGVARFWRAMDAATPPREGADAPRPLGASIWRTLKRVLRHDRFDDCETPGSRSWAHVFVLFGFAALSMVTLWVITASINPLLGDGFRYPFAFWSPWKLLANLGGVSLVAGLLLFVRERLREDTMTGVGTYFDWAFLVLLLLVAATGFVTEALHYLRLEPHRHIAYFVHLVCAFAVLVYLPYSKLAHAFYRGAAMVFAERAGWALPESRSDARDPTAEGS